MSRILIACVVLAVVVLLVVRVKRVWGKDVVGEPSTQPSAGAAQPAGPLAFVMKDIDGNDVDLSTLRGNPVLIVNVASRCGFTKQYAGLEQLHDTYKDRGLVVLGVPANDFKGQEPGTDEEIKAFCSSKYDVTFRMLSKVSVKGDAQHPLYKTLTDPSSEFGGEIGWNFTKFLIDRNGQVMARFASGTKPEDPTVIAAIEKALAAK